jgi:hypothetical protein
MSTSCQIKKKIITTLCFNSYLCDALSKLIFTGALAYGDSFLASLVPQKPARPYRLIYQARHINNYYLDVALRGCFILLAWQSGTCMNWFSNFKREVKQLNLDYFCPNPRKSKVFKMSFIYYF